MSSRHTVAVIGAGGTIGFGLASNLAKAGFSVRAWNRSGEKALPLTDDGAEIFASPQEAVDGADVIVTALFDTDATKDVMFGDDGALAAVNGSPVWVQMATLGAEGTSACVEEAAARGVGFVDAPVVGTKGPAMAGTLVIVASGDEAHREVVDPLFDAVGQKTLWVGGSGKGTDLKLVVNAWLVSVVEGIAETFALAQGIGTDPRDLMAALEGGPLDLGYLGLKGEKILGEDWEPQFALSGGAKDARLAADVAQAHGLDLPVLGAIADRMEQGVAEHGDKDLIATYLTSAPAAAAH